jgi:hypothetical protein
MYFPSLHLLAPKIFLLQGCGGLFACLRIVDRKEAPGLIFVRRHRTTACRPGEQLLWRIRSDSSCAQPRALKCRIDLERNNADAIVLAMTSPALVLTPLHANGGCVGDPCEASLSQTWRRALPKFTAACRILPELKRRNRQRTLGPISRQGDHLCPPWLGEKRLPRRPLSRTVRPTSCGCQVDNTTSCILRLSSRIRKITPKNSKFTFRAKQAPERVAPLLSRTCIPTRISPGGLSGWRRTRVNQLRIRDRLNLEARMLTQSLDSSPPVPPLQRPFSVQLCGWLWIVRKSGMQRPSAIGCQVDGHLA